jgi:hypothetical protein
MLAHIVIGLIDMDISGKVNLANKVALGLIYTEGELIRELESYDSPELVEDRDFLKYLSEVVICCSNCGVWQRSEDVKDYECPNCSDEWEEDE